MSASVRCSNTSNPRIRSTDPCSDVQSKVFGRVEGFREMGVEPFRPPGRHQRLLHLDPACHGPRFAQPCQAMASPEAEFDDAGATNAEPA